MFDFLDRLRQKPPEVRLFATVATAATLTGVIAIIWAVSFASTLSQANTAASIDSDSLDALRKQFNESVAGSKNAFDSLSEMQATSTARGVATSTVSATSSEVLSVPASTTPDIQNPKRLEGGIEVMEI